MSPSTIRYQMTAWRGAPSGSIVAMVAKCRPEDTKARRLSERGWGSVTPSMVREPSVP